MGATFTSRDCRADTAGAIDPTIYPPFLILVQIPFVGSKNLGSSFDQPPNFPTLNSTFEGLGKWYFFATLDSTGQ